MLDRLWFNVLSYLPEEERQKAASVVKKLEADFNQRKALQILPHKPAETIFFPDKIIQKRKESFVFFHSLVHKCQNKPFKFHISISSKDYASVLYKSMLNEYLQGVLVCPAEIRTLVSFKYTDPILLQKGKDQEPKMREGLQRFYNAILKYNHLKESNKPEDKALLKFITTWHGWYTKTWGNSFTNLNTLLEATPLELETHKKTGFAILEEIIQSIKRVDQEVQYTLYLSKDASIDNLVHQIKQISKYLGQLGVRKVPCPDSDLPLTPFVTFRQDRYTVNGTYIAADDKDSAKLKEFARNSEVYNQLVSVLGSFKDSQCLRVSSFS